MILKRRYCARLRNPCTGRDIKNKRWHETMEAIMEMDWLTDSCHWEIRQWENYVQKARPVVQIKV